MAIDFQQIYKRIKEIGAQAFERSKAMDEKREKARSLLSAFADQIDVLQSKVDRIVHEFDTHLRCALPVNERLDARFPLPPIPDQATLIAADGSQINPDRHAQVNFGLINVGAIALQLHSGQAPEIFTESELLFDDQLYTSAGTPLTEGLVALRRDLRERSKLDELSKDFSAPVVTFTDGPIELWSARDSENTQAYNESLDSYRTVLSRLQSRGVVTAGYVDKPAADLVIRLLEIASIPETQLKEVRQYHPLLGVSDRWLYGEKADPLLRPGERSAVFAIQSSSKKNYSGLLSLHFFYLNVGTEGHPWPVRVEVPQWVVDDPQKLDLLHAVLVQQCRIMGSKPYPYLLHRAHETAVVSFDERRQVEQMLALELRRRGSEMDEGSAKQAAKDQPGRTGYR